jgi:hypothetical protein
MLQPVAGMIRKPPAESTIKARSEEQPSRGPWLAVSSTCMASFQKRLMLLLIGRPFPVLTNRYRRWWVVAAGIRNTVSAAAEGPGPARATDTVPVDLKQTV